MEEGREVLTTRITQLTDTNSFHHTCITQLSQHKVVIKGTRLLDGVGLDTTDIVRCRRGKQVDQILQLSLRI